MKKMNFLLNSLLAMGICMAMVSCDSASEKYLNKYEKFVTSVAEKGNEMSQEDWTKAQAEHEEFMTEYSEDLKDEFTTEENQRFGNLQAQFAKAAMNKAFGELDNSMKQGAEVMEGYLDGLMESDEK